MKLVKAGPALVVRRSAYLQDAIDQRTYKKTNDSSQRNELDHIFPTSL